MPFYRSLSILFLILLLAPLTSSPALAAVTFELFYSSPTEEVILGSNEPLYLGIRYDSDLPVRFLPSALRQKEKREVGARTSSADLHASGQLKALTWISFDNPTHIDEVVVTAYDEAWNEVAVASILIDSRWSETIIE